MKQYVSLDSQDELHEECGVFAIYQNEDAAALTYYGLHALQHRGQEGCGIVTSSMDSLFAHKGKGLVSEVFHEAEMKTLCGNYAIGHVRYATAGGNEVENIQPLVANLNQDKFAVAHNGQIVNAMELRRELECFGSIFQGSSDSEIILHLIQQAKGTFLQRLQIAFSKLEGAFACVVLHGDEIYAIRDHNGLRPLSYASYQDGYLISSETCAFDVICAQHMDDVLPGEIVRFHKQGIEKCQYKKETSLHMCAMEYIYFARPDSTIDQINVHQARVATGKNMAQKDALAGFRADIVIGVPDSSTSAAIGYAQASGIPYEIGLIKNRYVGRTFIQPTQKQRERGVRMKLSAIESLVKDKSIVLIDDSIVRGTTSKRIVQLLKEAGAKEVHVRIASPAITHPCFYGVDTSSFEELISSRMDETQLCEYLQADSLTFMSVEDLFESYQSDHLCTACFNGNYATKLFQYGRIIEEHQLGK